MEQKTFGKGIGLGRYKNDPNNSLPSCLCPPTKELRLDRPTDLPTNRPTNEMVEAYDKKIGRGSQGRILVYKACNHVYSSVLKFVA